MLKQKFKRKLLCERSIVNNLFRYYEICSQKEIEDSKIWYSSLRYKCNKLANKYNTELYKVAGVFAATSPQCPIERNHILAEEALQFKGKKMVGNIARTLKCKNIINTATTPDEVYSLLSVKEDSALKTKSFFKNIFDPLDIEHVTIDVHAIASCIMRPDDSDAVDKQFQHMTKNQYMFFVNCYKVFANKIDMKPLDAQALIWEKRRECRNSKRNVLSLEVLDEIYYAFD